MDLIELQQDLAQERRRRLAAERLLEQKQAELGAANRQLSDHALSLSGQIIDQRKVVSNLKGENSRVSEDLHRAETRVVAAERLLWAALETIPDGFALFGPDFRLIAANGPYLRVFEETSGVAPGDSYQAILDICLDEGLVDLQGEDEDAWYDFMLDRWDTDDIAPTTLRFWNGMYVKMIDRRTSDGGIVSLALNITDTIAREEELRLARDKAQAADRAKSTFLAKMSHELRTPMNGVVGMADLLLGREQDDEARLYTETIRNSGDALLEIINNILDYSKLEADKVELRRAPFDLEAMTQDIVTLVAPSRQEKPITLHLDYDEALPSSFMGDGGRLRQIIINLVGNAIKFTKAGYVVLRISGQHSDSEEGVALNISVEDSGIGIPEDKRDHIFGEFNQIEDDANRQYEGTGLGLAITKKLISVMGGKLCVDSIEGEGSCFSFELNLKPVGAVPDNSAVPQLNPACPVLIWIGNRMDHHLVEQQLRSMGAEVWTAMTASEFDLALKRRRPQIAFCAIGRVEAAAAILAKSDRQIPLITVATTPDDKADLPKPFIRSDLRSALDAAICDRVPSCTDETVDHTIRVLAAEDNTTNQLVLTKMLDGLKIDLDMVGDGLQALESYESAAPDLIFLDISMPHMDGMEVARRIRKLELDSGAPRTPIVAMTAHALAGDETRIRDSGIDHYMTKPLKKELLCGHVTAVAASLGQSRTKTAS
ncbi:ATP-binding protein [uncultured Litoreibacter sp.]|uniref:ATP-binding protein n=1 Tax=uncultured Litoreibacter sp. TaxID=1392394 RepID=UPI00262EAF54|nr:ATP-binding protein [uncultured Litoreibacter sp.]